MIGTLVIGKASAHADALRPVVIRTTSVSAAIRSHASIAGYVITECTDVHWESNGLLDMARNPRVFHERFGEINADTVIVPLLVMYLLDLGGVGFLGPDEPRYASIGREMARSGDWITPRLDGEPWFEKPPLLYWMIAAGRRIPLPDE